jgi:hypothetical protein
MSAAKPVPTNPYELIAILNRLKPGSVRIFNAHQIARLDRISGRPGWQIVTERVSGHWEFKGRADGSVVCHKFPTVSLESIQELTE